MAPAPTGPGRLAAARSFLFVPADRPERLAKALASGADAVIVDFEDAVSPERKPQARQALAERWPALDAAARARLLVRINALGTPWHADDVRLLGDLVGLGGLMLPKAEGAADLAVLAAALPGVPVLPLVESAEGLAAADAIAGAAGVLRLAFGHLDFQADLGMEVGEDEAELAPVRLALVLASRRAGLPPPVDGVTTALQDAERLQQDCRRARRFGFGAKLCIHPSQVEAVNRWLGPTPQERDWALRVLAAAEAHAGGAFRFEGAMVDAPVLARARRLAAGFAAEGNA
ncbi:CoA ester lyase [Ramlibacter tataouinensis]|uniref:HpcH/HpaI aldolase/citrate lyase family protein n=1 Tax=Ramlibacter tataouinensis TaxID=94132 RepID=UPI0022F3AFAB|nr:CoA ester lyase [Ramlibacter tataouinensis]WBY03071.1 CoA ester lyase [Ramlibacter tataouinensis]